MRSFDTVYILGAGFSCNAGLPSQAEIGKHLLLHKGLGGPAAVNEAITAIIGDFIELIFHPWDLGESTPDLEDIYTCIDLSVEGGHFLGPHYTPKKLQALRHFLTHRVFQILEKDYGESAIITKLLGNALTKHTAFITLNWDLILERHLALHHYQPDYKCGALPIEQQCTSDTFLSVPTCKLHGSSNWAYCDNCKHLFYSPAQTVLQDHLFLFRNDFCLYDIHLEPAFFQTIPCPHCQIAHMSTHIATFSYRKQFRTNHFARIWHEAELLLQNARRWVFIGYSLPSADYQFRHVLKSAQLQMGKSPEIMVITKNNGRAMSPSVTRYVKFFGSCLLPHNIFHGGIEEFLRVHG